MKLLRSEWSRFHRWRGLALGFSLVTGGLVLALWCFARREVNDQEVSDPSHHSAGQATAGLEAGHSSQPFSKPVSKPGVYLGSAVCGECHAQIAETYRSHSMANSLWETMAAPKIEEASKKNSFSPDGRHWYTIETTPEGVFHHERLIDRDGETLYDQAVRVDYTMGSGHQGRSYLIDRGTAMYLSPITWYSHAGRWDLSPQYQLPVHRRFGRRIVDGCLNCHAGRVNDIRGASDQYGSPPFYELSIGCERCHGPGDEHVKLHRQGPRGAALDPIINPVKLDAARREDICSQCHLQGEGTYPRSGHEIGDFRPGERLEETRVIFVAGTRTTSAGTTRAVSQVEQMRSSRCYQESQGRFGCISCHDPHSRPQKTDMDHFYREKCLACHTDHGCGLPEAQRRVTQGEDSCIACHMPRLGASDVPHTSQTDHRVLRQQDANPIINRPSGPPEIYDGGESRLPPKVIDYARGLWLAEQAEKRNDREMAGRARLLLGQVRKDFPEDVVILNALGTSTAMSGRIDEAVLILRQSLDLDPAGEHSLETMANLLLQSGLRTEARPYLKRALESNPWKASLWGRYAGVLVQEGEWELGIEAAQKSRELDPSVLQTYDFLSNAYRHRGDSAKSQHYRDLSRKIQQSRQ